MRSEHTIEGLLAKLVAMPTVSDDRKTNEQALDFIEAWLKERGMYTKRYVFKGHGALMATVVPDAKTSRVLLYAHADVMSGTEDAFTMRREGDRLFGRGVFDMKFAIAGYMHFVDQVRDHLDKYDFSIMVTTDEEYGSADGINSIPDLMELGYRAAVCVMPDGGRAWDVEYMAKGFWRFDLIANGKTAHGSRPWEGDSASWKLINALHELTKAFAGHGPDTDTLNISRIHNEGTYNQVPDHIIAGLEIRLANEESFARNKKLLDSLCGSYGLRLRTSVIVPPIRQDINHPLLQAFMASITRITGHKSEPCLSQGGSDAEYFNEYGIPCAITYLPGGGHHGPHEWISHKALLQFPEVIHDYIERNARVADVVTEATTQLKEMHQN